MKKIEINVKCYACGTGYELTIRPKTPVTPEEIKKDFEKWECDECIIAGNKRFADALRQPSGVHFGKY